MAMTVYEREMYVADVGGSTVYNTLTHNNFITYS